MGLLEAAILVYNESLSEAAWYSLVISSYLQMNSNPLFLSKYVDFPNCHRDVFKIKNNIFLHKI